MKETLHEKATRIMKPCQIYGYKEIIKAICPTQSSTAEYILDDMVTAGVIERVLNGFRLVR